MPLTIEELTKLMQDYRDESDDAHQRLRGTLRDIQSTVESNFRHFEDQNSLIRAKMAEVSSQVSQPIDATKLVLTTKSIVALIMAAIAIVASYWSLSNKLDTQQRLSESSAKLQEVQMKALADVASDAKSTAADAKRQYELLRYDFQSLKETVIGKDKTK